jgi:hypothetical protein
VTDRLRDGVSLGEEKILAIGKEVRVSMRHRFTGNVGRRLGRAAPVRNLHERALDVGGEDDDTG